MEKKVKPFLLFCLLILSIDSVGQDTNRFKSNMLILNVGLKQSFLYTYANKPLFADGFFEFLTKENFGIKGSCTQYITDRTPDKMFQNLTGIAFGGAYYLKLPNPAHKLSASVQPGISWVNLTSIHAGNDVPSSLIPTMTISLNYMLVFSRFTNFYVNVSHQSAYVRGTKNNSINLSGFSITGGLGFHLLMKTKKSDK